jgi:iron complex transport system substrate-binding protein
MTKGLRTTALALLLALVPAWAAAQVSMRDDLGRTVQLKKKPERIVTLAPFLTEAVYAAGAGDRLVAVSKLSDYPPEASKLPQLGTGAEFSLTQLATYKPDLVLVWTGGMRRNDVENIHAFGATVYAASARTLEDVPRTLRAIGLLTGNDVSAVVDAYESKVEKLRRENQGKTRVAAFLELWNRPLTTISSNHFMAEALEICHADNVFKDLEGSAPQVTIDELYEKNPFVIIGAGSATNAEEFRSNWNVRQGLRAVKENRLVFVDSDAFQRPTPRTPEGIALLCNALDEVRPQGPRQPQQREAAPNAPTATQRPSQFGM